MADNNRSSFGLSKLRDGIESKTSELSTDAQPRGTDGSFLDRNKPFTFENEDYDRTEAPRDDMRDYWRKFETTPIIRKPITSFASRVVEPGYYIESDQLDADEIREIGVWLDSCAIVEGKPGRDFRELAKKAVVQREVRGTALVEKAPHEDDPDRVAGLKLINPETVEAVTVPEQSILMPPDGEEKYGDEVPEAESGGAAAWLQDILETEQTYFRSNFTPDEDGDVKIGFQRDEIIPLRRDADVGEIFGTSRVEAVSTRVEGIKNKLDDNDQAIASKAYPLYVFMFGDPDSEEGVWDSEDINDFMSAHEMDNFEPGMKQGVRGDVSIETVSGEVADIAEYLRFDIQWIMASMPMPMFLLGSFGETGGVGQVAGVAQQQDVIRQIEDARRELEDEFTPVVREVARQKGFDQSTVESINLRFGNPNAPDESVRQSQQTIRYVSDAGGDDEVQRPSQQPQTPQVDPQPQTGSPKENGPLAQGLQPLTGGTEENTDAQINSQYADVWSARTTAELEQALDESGNREQLTEVLHEFFLTVRNRTLDQVEDRYSTTPKYAATEFENIANRSLNNAVRQTRIKHTAGDLLRESLPTDRHRDVRFYSQNVENAARDAGEAMLRTARKLVRDAVVTGESWSQARARIEQRYDSATLRERAALIAQMEQKNATETSKLQEFEQSDDIIGIRVTNTDPSTDVTQSLAGSEAYFDRDKTVGEQLAQEVASESLDDGFDPLPQTPPYHFNDTTTLEPIYKE